jgi:hypothetical protein
MIIVSLKRFNIIKITSNSHIETIKNIHNKSDFKNFRYLKKISYC